MCFVFKFHSGYIYTPVQLTHLTERDNLNSILVIFIQRKKSLMLMCLIDLNSILVIFILRRIAGPFLSVKFKFHSGYIYTLSTYCYQCTTHLFKFHSGYIYTTVTQPYRTGYIKFKFHSGYIYTSLPSTIKLLKAALFKFHSGYIYTE